MALTEFQIKKVVSVFQRLYDSNKDGVIDQKDFSDAIEKISALHHWGKNDEQYNKAKSTLQDIWDGLKKGADTNQDGIVTQDEWIAMWTNTLANINAGKPFPAWQQQYMEFMFYANDTSGDGFIDRGEYVTIQTLFGNNEEESQKAFDIISKDKKDGLISKEDFQNLWHEFFLSTDKENKGNYLFGMPPC